MPWTMSPGGFPACVRKTKGILYTVLEKAFNEVGMHLLFTECRDRTDSETMVRPIRSPNLANLKMRFPQRLKREGADLYGKGTGMTPTGQWGVLYNAMSRKVVDG